MDRCHQQQPLRILARARCNGCGKILPRVRQYMEEKRMQDQIWATINEEINGNRNPQRIINQNKRKEKCGICQRV